ncbi:MAG: DUF86 domain-containing protein [Deltaproteobacteria bacterium]|nr:DUF86 domain-containing protein [Deltaproteobacteria bacterium]
MSPALEKDVILKRVNGIQAELAELKKLGARPFEEFKNGVGFRLAQFHLYRALEGVFNIGSHILSRIPGGQATQYREIGLKLGEHGIVDREFAEKKLVLMGRYRNRLAHFYAEITAEEIYEILQDHLGDFETFLGAVKALLKDPGQHNLTVE